MVERCSFFHSGVLLRPPLTDIDRARFIDAAWRALDEDEVGKLLVDLIDIPSPTGGEAPLARYLVHRLEQRGFEVTHQVFSADRANVIGRLSGEGGGSELLLFSPIDTPWSGEPDDVQGLPLENRPDFEPFAQRIDGLIVGLGAANPKAFVASILAATEAVAQGGFGLPGSVTMGLAAGGMPVRSLSNAENAGGHGVGCRHMLDVVNPDFAVVTKPGYAIAYEEAGLLWYRIRVHGKMAYTGMRHLLPYVNPIVGAARVVEALEDFFPRYSKGHTSGLIAPQGAVGSVVAGWPNRPAFVPAYADVFVDVRRHWKNDPEEVDRELDDQLRSIDMEGMEITWERLVSFPAGHTNPESWIIQSVVKAWEAVEGRRHMFRTNTSGISEANLLREQGIPTARIGMPTVEPPAQLAGFSMGVTSTGATLSLARILCVVIIDLCSRRAEEMASEGN